MTQSETENRSRGPLSTPVILNSSYRGLELSEVCRARSGEVSEVLRRLQVSPSQNDSRRIPQSNRHPSGLELGI